MIGHFHIVIEFPNNYWPKLPENPKTKDGLPRRAALTIFQVLALFFLPLLMSRVTTTAYSAHVIFWETGIGVFLI